MRDEFSEPTKRILASRTAYRCSFPGCTRITIGPGSNNNKHVISIGEAAHIYSAAPNGPRSNPHLTTQERISVDNGIWMCKTHARLIDVDEMNYSADTLQKWKTDAENFVRERLETLEKEIFPEPLTLIMLNPKLILECRWIHVEGETWKFKLYNFIDGDKNTLNDHIAKFPTLKNWEKYILVESQGDGRLVHSLSLTQQGDGYVLCCKLWPKLPRTNPHELGGDIALEDDGDLAFSNGDFKIVSGLDNAFQIIRTILSWEPGWWANPYLGSNFNAIYRKHNENLELLNRIVKLELVRLFTVSTPGGIIDHSEEMAPELNFINRINWVKIQQSEPSKSYLLVFISLEWGNNENWEGELKIPF